MKKTFERIVQALRDSCDPDEILLFGSFAKGTATVHSDIDVMVVGEFGPRRRAVERAVTEAMLRMPIKVDVLVLAPAEVDQARRAPHSFPGSALLSSKSLYKKTARVV
jgi:predicted nucleotidyltransferase